MKFASCLVAGSFVRLGIIGPMMLLWLAYSPPQVNCQTTDSTSHQAATAEDIFGLLSV